MHSDWWQMPDFLTEGIMRTALKPAIGATMIALAAMSGAASAAPLETLYFTQSSQYDGAPSFNNSQGLVPLLATPTKFQWTSTLSNPDATSSLEIFSYNSASAEAASGDLNANGLWNANEWFRIDQLVQHNEVLSVPAGVPNPNPLWSGSIIGTFAVFQNSDFTGPLLTGGSDTTTTSLRYWETTNVTTGLDNCDGPTPLGSICDDEYTVLALSLAPLAFTLDGYEYTIDFRLEPATGTIVCVNGDLSPACQAAGVTFGAGELMKVYAAELDESNLFVAARWTATQIPEPGVLGLLGIGLMGMGLSARRRKATAA